MNRVNLIIFFCKLCPEPFSPQSAVRAGDGRNSRSTHSLTHSLTHCSPIRPYNRLMTHNCTLTLLYSPPNQGPYAVKRMPNQPDRTTNPCPTLHAQFVARSVVQHAVVEDQAHVGCELGSSGVAPALHFALQRVHRHGGQLSERLLMLFPWERTSPQSCGNP